jgi:uncharacterized protein involved in outer membrane biogenesis
MRLRRGRGRLFRRIATIAGGLAVAALVLAVAGFLLLGRFDLAPLAASRASAALGRTVTIAGLHITPGRWLTVTLQGVRIANLPGGTQPAMATLQSLTAEVDALSLLHGPAMIRHLQVDGLSVLLERVAGDKRNWRFGGAPKRSRGGRSGFPTLLDAHVQASEITVRTSEGHRLQTRIDDLTLSTASADAPVKLALTGAYHDTPVTLNAELRPIAVLRDAAVPYGADIHIASGDTALHFKGTMTEPLNADGAEGMIKLHAPTLAPILAMAGVPDDAFKAALDLSATLKRSDPVWTLTDLTGSLDDSTIAPSNLRLHEGGYGDPDDLTLDLAFDRMDLDRLLAGRGPRKGPDTPMRVESNPDPRLNLHLTARQLAYAGTMASGVALKLAVAPGQITVDELAAEALGAKLTASGHAEAPETGGHAVVEASVSGVDVQQLRRLTGGSAVPLAGRVDAQAYAEGAGDTLDAAARAAHGAAVAWMTSGSISIDLLEKASTDIRLIFRKPTGMAPVSCLLGVLEWRKGVGTLAPLRIRTADGTIAGEGTVDLLRHQIDVTISSQPDSTSTFALDVPVRISGTINDPAISPATRSVAQAAPDLTQLPPLLRPAVQRNPCAR